MPLHLDNKCVAFALLNNLKTEAHVYQRPLSGEALTFDTLGVSLFKFTGAYSIVGCKLSTGFILNVNNYFYEFD